MKRKSIEFMIRYYRKSIIRLKLQLVEAEERFNYWLKKGRV